MIMIMIPLSTEYVGYRIAALDSSNQRWYTLMVHSTKRCVVPILTSNVVKRAGLSPEGGTLSRDAGSADKGQRIRS